MEGGAVRHSFPFRSPSIPKSKSSGKYATYIQAIKIRAGLKRFGRTMASGQGLKASKVEKIKR
jgi:hypothetical protein